MKMNDSALEIMLRDLRESGANRGEPCGVHDRPQWTCAFCLHNVLAEIEAAPPRADALKAQRSIVLVDAILVELRGREGFYQAWEQTEPVHREQIKRRLCAIIDGRAAALDAAPAPPTDTPEHH